MVDISTPSRDLKPSPELFEMIQAAASSLTGFAQLWESIRKKGTHEGFTETQLQDLIKPLLKAQLHMSREQIWYMFNKEKKAITNKEAYESRRINTPIVEKKEPEQNDIHIIEGKELADEVNEIAKIQGVDLSKADMNKTREILSNISPEEDPLKIENEFLKEKVSELEEALKKTQQFQPANVLEGEARENVKGMGFEFLREMADGIHSFFYDAYGIDLFKNRELPQLKNSGVKVFRRLYFEV